MCSDLSSEPSFKGQTRTAKLKSADNLLIIGPRGMQWDPTYRKSWAGNLLMWSHLALDPSFKGETRRTKLKSADNLLIIGPRGMQCETNL